MLWIEYIVEMEQDAAPKLQYPNLSLPVVGRCLLLETLIHLITVLLALGTGIDHGMYQAQLIRTLGTRRYDVMD